MWMGRYCEPPLYKHGNSWGTASKALCKPLKHNLLRQINWLLDKIWWYVQFWERGELNALEENGINEKRKCANLQTDCEKKFIVNVTFSSSTLTEVRTDWFKAFVSSELGALHDCHIAEISKKVKKIILVGTGVRLTEFKPEQYLNGSDILRSFSADESSNKSAYWSLHNASIKSIYSRRMNTSISLLPN